jgi:hypothetical protein
MMSNTKTDVSYIIKAEYLLPTTDVEKETLAKR